MTGHWTYSLLISYCLLYFYPGSSLSYGRLTRVVCACLCSGFSLFSLSVPDSSPVSCCCFPTWLYVQAVISPFKWSAGTSPCESIGLWLCSWLTLIFPSAARTRAVSSLFQFCLSLMFVYFEGIFLLINELCFATLNSCARLSFSPHIS